MTITKFENHNQSQLKAKPMLLSSPDWIKTTGVGALFVLNPLMIIYHAYITVHNRSLVSMYLVQESECLGFKTSDFTLNTSVTCQSLAVYTNQELISHMFFQDALPFIFSHLRGVVGAWGAGRLGAIVTAAGWVVATVLLSSTGLTHQDGQLLKMTLTRWRLDQL